jgi:hypothetical protein
MARRKRSAILTALALTLVETAVVSRRRGFLFGTDTVVRCHRGHLFTTIWIPAVSLKAVRLGWWRFQRCPVGKHWSFVTPVNAHDLGPVERRRAAHRHDVRLP